MVGHVVLFVIAPLCIIFGPTACKFPDIITIKLSWSARKRRISLNHANIRRRFVNASSKRDSMKAGANTIRRTVRHQPYTKYLGGGVQGN